MANQAIGVDIGSHAVKIAVLQKKGGVTKAVRLYRSTVAGDEEMERVRGAIRRSGIAGGPGLLGISGRDLIIRYTHVPPVPDWRLKLLMQFEINEVSGQSGEEVAADYKKLNLPVDGDEDTVLVALARNKWLSPRLDAATSSGIKAAGGCPNSVAVFNAFLAHGTWKDGETVYLVNLGRGNIDMAIQRDGELLFARNMAGGGQMFTEAIMSTFGLKEPKSEKNKITKGDLTPKGQARYPDATSEKLANAMLGPAGQLVSMIQSTVMISRAQTKMSDLNVDRLVLTGGGARMKGVREYFAANMSVPVEIFDPVAELDLSTLEPADQDELGDDAYDFSVAIGLAETLLLPAALPLEVLAEKEKKKRYFAQRTIWSLAAAAAALLLVVMLFKTRAADIEAVEETNELLGARAKRAEKYEKTQLTAIAAEKSARKKEVTLRARRLAGSFTRAIQDVLYKNHKAHLFLERFEMSAEKRVSLDLEGRPTAGRALIGAEDKEGNAVHNQPVWPVITVIGRVQPEYTSNPGQTLQDYYTQLGQVLGGMKVGGWDVKFDTQALDRNNRFEMTFTLKGEPKPEEG